MSKAITFLLSFSLASLIDYLINLSLPGNRNTGDLKAVPVFITEKNQFNRNKNSHQ